MLRPYDFLKINTKIKSIAVRPSLNQISGEDSLHR